VSSGVYRTLPLPASGRVSVDAADDRVVDAIRSFYERSSLQVSFLHELSLPVEVAITSAPETERVQASADAVAPGGALVIVGTPASDASLDGSPLVLAEVNLHFVSEGED
jgi:hypothetical protein